MEEPSYNSNLDKLAPVIWDVGWKSGWDGGRELRYGLWVSDASTLHVFVPSIGV